MSLNLSPVQEKIAISLLMVFITAAVYLQSANHAFISLDDHTYLVGNSHVSSGITWENISWAFSSFHEGNWHPLTWMSHMLDCTLYGLDPKGHHLTNVAIHLINTLLLFLLLNRLTGSTRRSGFVAALFALHPLHVESVAWIAERKDLLAGLFWLLTLLAYTRYAGDRRPASYLGTLSLFALGLLCKPMLVTLPLVLLLLDYWPLRRLGWRHARNGERSADALAPVRETASKILGEKIPFLLLSGISCSITVKAQLAGGSMEGTAGLALRLANALVSYTSYIGKLLWPSSLAVFYPYPETIDYVATAASAILLAALTLTAIAGARRFPYALVGWLWYLGTLVPVIGLVQVGSQSMADRYTYLPLIGLFLAVSWGMEDIVAKLRLRGGVFAGLACGISLLAATATWHQLSFWENSAVLFSHALAVTGPNPYMNSIYWAALQNLKIESGLERARQGDIDGAVSELRALIAADPNQSLGHYNLGTVLAWAGRHHEAIPYLTRALELDPGNHAASQQLAESLSAVANRRPTK